jgi:hypothetical protein
MYVVSGGAGERTKAEAGLLQRQAVPEAHDAQSDAVQNRQGVFIRAR